MQPQAWQSDCSRVPISIAPLPALRKSSWSKSVRNSALNERQLCRKSLAALPKEPATLPEASFDMAGLIGWLKSRFPTSTEFHVASATGIQSDSIGNWIRQRSRPSAEHLSILLCVFGPSLFRACIRHQANWIDRACEAERLDEIDQQISRLNSERAALMK